mmetsp:Transcript_89538/g.232150  ORF Transcript_89538/g.232150 Transcript_89538/m.232150 type:complete len:533 (+) Transcript_89538:205-1803(+)
MAGLDDHFGHATGGTASFSNTICVSDPKEEWSSVTPETVRQLSVFGAIARLDTSLMSTLKCVLVTYFDVRCTQKALLELAGRSEQFPQADHDFRIVLVSTAAYMAKVGIVGSFNQFGEVANISMHRGDAIVEYYDMRSAQRLCAIAGDCASPCMPRQQAWPHSGVPSGNSLLAGGGLGAANDQSQLAALQQMVSGLLPSFTGSVEEQSMTRLAKAALAAEEGNLVKQALQGLEPGTVDTAGAVAAEQRGNTVPGGNRPVRTKISNKDFSKYDINPEKIARGEDPRTTVMVRNLVGPKARKDFLKFLEKCGLNDRYTFFYMPCKEHRDVRAGFAFVNFRSAEDVRKLYADVRSDMWQKMRKGDPQCKPLAMSYARFQGHDELMAHFSSSVVLHEQDPEKRPIFCPENGIGNDDGSRAALSEADGAAAPLRRDLIGAPGLTAAPNAMAAVADGSPSSAGDLSGDPDLHAALARGMQEIAAILSRDQQSTLKGQPAYIPAPGLSPNSSALSGGSPVVCTREASPNGQVHLASIGG